MGLQNFFDSIYRHSQKHKYEQFFVSMRDLKEIQEQILFSIINRNKDSEFGKQHDFEGIRSISQFRNRVPVQNYHSLQTAIERMMEGELNILTSDDVFLYAKSAGQTGNPKFIPYTRELFEEFQRGTTPMLFDLLSRNPEIANGKSYWSLGPSYLPHETTFSGISIGQEGRVDFLLSYDRTFFKEHALIYDDLKNASHEDYLLQTSKRLLEEEELSIMFFRCPLALIELLHYIAHECSSWSLSLSSAARHRLQLFLDQGKKNFSLLWPKLCCIFCNMEGAAAFYFPFLDERFSNVTFVSREISSIEGIISVPFGGHRDTLLAGSCHFYEFQDLEGKVVGPEALLRGFIYIPIITTSGGLYRYFTGDLVEVTGHSEQLPLLRYVGRYREEDLCDEGITEERLIKTIELLMVEFSYRPHFHFVSPYQGQKNGYIYFLETEQNIDRQLLEARFEELLLEYHHYNMSRLVGDLAPIKVKFIQNGWRQYCDQMKLRGIKSYEDIKLNLLSEFLDWADRLQTF